MHESIRELRRKREQWSTRPDLLVRAARHYEGAIQLLIRNVLKSSDQVIVI